MRELYETPYWDLENFCFVACRITSKQKDWRVINSQLYNKEKLWIKFNLSEYLQNRNHYHWLDFQRSFCLRITRFVPDTSEITWGLGRSTERNFSKCRDVPNAHASLAKGDNFRWSTEVVQCSYALLTSVKRSNLHFVIIYMVIILYWAITANRTLYK